MSAAWQCSASGINFAKCQVCILGEVLIIWWTELLIICKLYSIGTCQQMREEISSHLRWLRSKLRENGWIFRKKVPKMVGVISLFKIYVTDFPAYWGYIWPYKNVPKINVNLFFTFETFPKTRPFGGEGLPFMIRLTLHTISLWKGRGGREQTAPASPQPPSSWRPQAHLWGRGEDDHCKIISDANSREIKFYLFSFSYQTCLKSRTTT